MKSAITFASLVVALLACSCASHKAQYQEASLSFPELGSIVQTKGQLWYATAEQVGRPKWKRSLEVTVQELPFNKKSYTTYATYMAKASKMNGIPYRDSLPYKPKYLRLQLRNKIGLTTQLNHSDNSEVREFIKTDDAYKIVTRLDISVPDVLMPQFLGANQVVLKEGQQRGIHLVLINGKQETTVTFTEVQVFDYEFSSFCWGEDRYHHKRIETLLSGNEKCPKGTFKKAAKVTSDRAYLKF